MKLKKNITIVLCIIILMVGAYFLPLPTNRTNPTDDGHRFVVPSFMMVEQSSESSVTFTSFRSNYALTKDLANALATYDVVVCQATQYYYDESEDIAITKATLNADQLLNTLTYEYVSSNPCLGWTTDDEVKYYYSDLSALDEELVVEELLDTNYVIITEDETHNIDYINSFYHNHQNSIPAYLRIVDLSKEQTVVDFQHLQDNTVRITVDQTRSGGTIEEIIVDRVSLDTNDTGTLINGHIVGESQNRFSLQVTY